MKKKLFVHILIWALAVSVLYGCGKKDNDNQDKQPGEQVEQSDDADQNNEVTGASSSDENETSDVIVEAANTIHVKNAEEFLMAIASDVNIVLDAGTYNLSGVIRDESKVTGNENLYLSYASMDSEVVVSQVSNMTITGPKDGKAEIVIEDPYSAVMVFEDCQDVALSNVTMGHTVEKGYCSGSVVRLNNCDNMTLTNNDLYGCGTYGIECYRSQGIRVNDCTIRECSYGIVSIWLSSDVEFNNCMMKECEDLDLIDVRTSSVTFKKCVFENNKTDYDFVAKDSKSSVIFKGCFFGELETERINEQIGGLGTCIFDEQCTFKGNILKPVITVSSAKELLDAIRPGATIYLKPGEYNLSECAQQIYEERGNVWNRTHEYVNFEEVYDGIEIVLNGIENLTIYGLGETRNDVTLLVNPRYASVFRLSYCNNVTFMNLTAGHTDRGTCVGNVIDIYGGSGFIFNNVDLFGCGVNGIGAYDICQEIYIYDSIIHDCEYGPFEISGAVNNILVVNTELTGSNGGGYYAPGGYFLTFFKCKFGEQESNTLYFIDTSDKDIEISQCYFSEITEYPDYGDDWEYYPDYEPDDGGDIDYDYAPAFNRDALRVVPFDAATIEDSMYKGYYIIDNNTGDEISLTGEGADPNKFVEVFFYIDGSANIYGIDDIKGQYTWDIDSSYSGVLTSADGKKTGRLSLYSDTSEGESTVWMMIVIENKTIWLY